MKYILLKSEGNLL